MKKYTWKSIALEIFWMWHDWWGDTWHSIAEWANEEDCQFIRYVAMTKTVYHRAMDAVVCEKMSNL